MTTLDCTFDDNCEYDCKYLCTGCDRWFHDIKNEDNLDHSLELPEAMTLNCGDHYCHIDCFRDCH